jgi:hypothetical protein
MEIRPAVSLPAPIRKEILRQPVTNDLVPGFILGVGDILDRDAVLKKGLSQFSREHGLSGIPGMLVDPAQTPLIFDREQGLDLVKSLAKLAAGMIHPQLKTGIEGISPGRLGIGLFQRLARQADRGTFLTGRPAQIGQKNRQQTE